MHRILDFHLSDKTRFHLSNTKDELVAFDDLLDLIYRAQEFYTVKRPTHPCQQRVVNGKGMPLSTIPSIATTFIIPSSKPSVPSPLMPRTNLFTNAPTPIKDPKPTLPDHPPDSAWKEQISDQHPPSIPSELNPIFLYKAPIDGSGWVQINNVCLPFLLKHGQRLVPYHPLVSCQILNSQELMALLTRATAADITLINQMIRECRIHSNGLVENTPLINLQHLLMGSSALLYVKILPKEVPKQAINRQYKNVLALHGGCLSLPSHTIPFVSSSHRSYVSLNSIASIYPDLRTVLQSFAHAPAVDDLEYLQLIQVYYGNSELPSDTLVINLEYLEQMQIIALKKITLEEYQAEEKRGFEQQVLAIKKLLMYNGKRKHPAHRSNPSSGPKDQSRAKRSRWQ